MMRSRVMHSCESRVVRARRHGDIRTIRGAGAKMLVAWAIWMVVALPTALDEDMAL